LELTGYNGLKSKDFDKDYNSNTNALVRALASASIPHGIKVSIVRDANMLAKRLFLLIRSISRQEIL